MYTKGIISIKCNYQINCIYLFFKIFGCPGGGGGFQNSGQPRIGGRGGSEKWPFLSDILYVWTPNVRQ